MAFWPYQLTCDSETPLKCHCHLCAYAGHMTQKASAATQRRSIGRQLKAAREAHYADRANKEMPLAEAAAALHVSTRTLRRLEGGEVRPNFLLVKGACLLYGFADEAMRRILEMVEQADEDEWYEKYRQDISPWLVQLLDLEAVADRIHIYAALVPGPCQTPAYTEALGAKNPKHPNDPDYARRLAEIRVRRAHNIFDRQGVKVSIVIDQLALVRQIGGAEVMEEQIEHLRSLERRRNVTVRFVPLTAGATAATKGDFSLLEFDDEKEPDLAYMETYAAGQYSVKPPVLDELRKRYGSLLAQAVHLKEYER